MSDIPLIYPIKVKDWRSGEEHYRIKEWIGEDNSILWPGRYSTPYEAREAIAAQQQSGR